MNSCAMKRNNLCRCVGGAKRASSCTGATSQISDLLSCVAIAQKPEVDIGFRGLQPAPECAQEWA